MPIQPDNFYSSTDGLHPTPAGNIDAAKVINDWAKTIDPFETRWEKLFKFLKGKREI